MRVVDEIPHHTFKITLFSMNDKYVIKIELGAFEQIYKVGQMDVTGTADIRKMLTEPFLEQCMRRFLRMREDFTKTRQSIEHEV